MTASHSTLVNRLSTLDKAPGLLLLGLLLGLSMAVDVRAQEFGRAGSVDAAGTSYHLYAEPGEATVQVSLLGSVTSPGIYEIGTGTDLGKLLALAGGAGIGVRSPGEVRETTVRVLRQEGDRRSPVYEAPIEQTLAEPSRYPRLQDGDVILVETVVRQRQPFGWRDALSILTTLTSVAVLVTRFVQ